MINAIDIIAGMLRKPGEDKTYLEMDIQLTTLMYTLELTEYERDAAFSGWRKATDHLRRNRPVDDEEFAAIEKIARLLRERKRDD